MKKTFTKLFTLILLLCAAQVSIAQTGCSAQFTWKPGNTLNNIMFTSALNPTNTHYLWTFGDNSKSDMMNPPHTYANPGTYWVCLSVTDTLSNGTVCQDQHCDSVRVGTNTNPTCDAHFTFTVDTANTIHLNGATNPTGTTYQWTFGDGGSGSGTPTDHHYANKGTYWVCLTVTVPGINGTVACKTDHCDSVHVGNVNPPPTCCAKFTFQAGNTLNSVVFTGCTNAVATQYCWNYGDGSPVNCTTNLKTDHTYPGPGAYVVCCDVSVPNNGGGVGCTAHFCDTVKIGNPPPPPTCDAHFVVTKIDTTTHTIWVTGAFNPTGTAYGWNWGDGTSGSGNPADHKYTKGGTYWVCLTVEVPGAIPGTTACRSQWCDSVHIGGNAPPPPPPTCNAKFTYKVDTSKCVVNFFALSSSLNSGTSYVWHFGDGTSGSGNPADHRYMKPGTYWVCLNVYVKNAGGVIICKDEHCDSIHVYCSTPPPPPPPICTARFVFKIDTTTNTVYVNGDPNPAGTVYHWTWGDGTSGTANPADHRYTIAGVYTICLVVETPAPNSYTPGCRNSYCVKVAVGVKSIIDTCSAKFRYYFDYNMPRTVKFQSAPNPPGTFFTWTFGDGDTSHDANPTHTFRDTGLITVCLSVSSILANSLPCTDKWCRTLYINGPIINPDGGSDQVVVYPNPSIGNAVVAISDVDQPTTIQIYNNKGEMVFKREDLNNGNYPVNNLQPGLYFYRVVSGGNTIGSGKMIVQ
jgi:PKD repeat protein